MKFALVTLGKGTKVHIANDFRQALAGHYQPICPTRGEVHVTLEAPEIESLFEADGQAMLDLATCQGCKYGGY